MLDGQQEKRNGMAEHGLSDQTEWKYYKNDLFQWYYEDLDDVEDCDSSFFGALESCKFEYHQKIKKTTPDIAVILHNARQRACSGEEGQLMDGCFVNQLWLGGALWPDDHCMQCKVMVSSELAHYGWGKAN